MPVDFTSVSWPLVDAASRKFLAVDIRPHQRDGCGPMQLETKFLRLGKPVKLGEEIDGWRVSWLGGWGKDRIFFFVMVVREIGGGQ